MWYGRSVSQTTVLVLVRFAWKLTTVVWVNCSSSFYYFSSGSHFTKLGCKYKVYHFFNCSWFTLWLCCAWWLIGYILIMIEDALRASRSKSCYQPLIIWRRHYICTYHWILVVRCAFILHFDRAIINRKKHFKAWLHLASSIFIACQFLNFVVPYRVNISYHPSTD